MAVFEISTTYQQDDISISTSFKGFMTLDEKNNEIRGYMETLSPFVQPVKRYIYGLYERDKNVLAYLQLSNNKNLVPLMFIFYNIQHPGIWSSYDEDLATFFPFRSFNGRCQVELKEITIPADVERISRNVFSTFAESSDLMSNIILIYKGVQPYMDLGLQ